jgi:hypothetical protein
MSQAELLANELRLWSAVPLGRGETTWADLLDLAARQIALRQVNPAAAEKLRLYASIVEPRQQRSFQVLLLKAADALTQKSQQASDT